MGRKRRRNRVLADDQPKLSAEEKFQMEYAYVIKDLRSILILAVVMFALLIVLNLVLQG